jgi:hypothetical protein
MNCRPGDLAFIVGLPALFGLNDKPVKLANLPPVIWMPGTPPQWRLEAPVFFRATRNVVDLAGTRYFAGDLVGIDALADGNLRPIRDPGADAVDEMVQRVGRAPMTLTEILQGEVTS